MVCIYILWFRTICISDWWFFFKINQERSWRCTSKFQTPSLSQTWVLIAANSHVASAGTPFWKYRVFGSIMVLIMFLKVMVRSSRNPSESDDHFFDISRRYCIFGSFALADLDLPVAARVPQRQGRGQGVQCQPAATMGLSHDGQRIQKMMKFSYNY